MANTKVAASFKNSAGKQALLPPKSPYPTMAQSYADNGFTQCTVPKGIPRAREGQRNHQRTSSEGFLIDEQPSWFDDLLDEPELPVRKGAHRRSSSDSFAYTDVANIYSNVHKLAPEEQKHRGAAVLSSWESQEFDHLKDVPHPSYFMETNSFGMLQNRGWQSALNMVAYPGNLPATKDKTKHPSSSNAIKEPQPMASAVGKEDQEGPTQDSSEGRDASHPKQSQFEVDSKRVKQQFAQRSRVRKLQYIAELERNVQALQAEGMEVSAELEFLDRQNLILNLENKTLKQRLDNLAQEQLIKHLQQEMLEREIARLRAMYQQQQQQLSPQQPTPTHNRSTSRDLDAQFANLSLKHWEVTPAWDPITGPIHI